MGGRDVWGAVLSVISSVISNFGINLQKRVHLQNDARAPTERIPYTKVTAWWFGQAGVIFGAIGDFIALGLASQAVCTALGGATTLWANILIAKYWLKEDLTRWYVLSLSARAAAARRRQALLDLTHSSTLPPRPRPPPTVGTLRASS
jgi:hypothetical protein